MNNWLRDTIASSNGEYDKVLGTVNVESLNEKQKKAFDAVVSQHDSWKADKTVDPMPMLVLGTAGTGKSYLISALKQTLW